MSDNPTDWLNLPTRITRDGRIFFGEHPLPGLIADNSVTVLPGRAGDAFNTLRVEFLVGAVEVEDRTEEAGR